MRAFLAALALCLCIVASAHAENLPPTRSGVASCYGREHGQTRTATGQNYDPSRLTAAHRTWPFGTRVRVCNLSRRTSGLAGGASAARCVIVLINDRGPYVGGRAVDLSLGACCAIGNSGLARVSLQLLEFGYDPHLRARHGARHFARRHRRVGLHARAGGRLLSRRGAAMQKRRPTTAELAPHGGSRSSPA